MRFRAPLQSFWSALFVVLLVPALAAAQKVEESVETFPLDADGRISLENLNGDVVVEAWDRDEVQIRSVKRSRTQRGLDRVAVVIDASPGRIHVETDYRESMGDWMDGASVDFTLSVPRAARIDALELVNGSLSVSGTAGELKAELVNGRAEIAGVRGGDVEVTTVNGVLDATFDTLGAGQSITLESVNGELILRLPNRADAEIEASTVHGKINNDFGLEEERGRHVGSELEGVLGAGGARIELSNVNGSIDIRAE